MARRRPVSSSGGSVLGLRRFAYPGDEASGAGGVPSSPCRDPSPANGAFETKASSGHSSATAGFLLAADRGKGKTPWMLLQRSVASRKRPAYPCNGPSHACDERFSAWDGPSFRCVRTWQAGIERRSDTTGHHRGATDRRLPGMERFPSIARQGELMPAVSARRRFVVEVKRSVAALQSAVAAMKRSIRLGNEASYR